MIRRDKLSQLLAGEVAGLPSWQDFKERLNGEEVRFPCKRPPLLFAGAGLPSWIHGSQLQTCCASRQAEMSATRT